MFFHAYLAFSSSAYLELGQLAEPINNLLNMAFSDCATAKMLIRSHLCSEYLLQKGYILRVRESGAKWAYESKERGLEINKYVLFSWEPLVQGCPKESEHPLQLALAAQDV